MSKIDNKLLQELDEMIVKMGKACEIYRPNVNIAKKLNVEMPVELKIKIRSLAALIEICENFDYCYRSKDDVLFGSWVTRNDSPTQVEISVVVNLLNQYLDLKHEVGTVDYFIPDELCGK